MLTNTYHSLSNNLQPTSIRTGTQLLLTPGFLLPSHPKLYLPTKNPEVFTTILYIPHEDLAHRNTISNSTA